MCILLYQATVSMCYLCMCYCCGCLHTVGSIYRISLALNHPPFLLPPPDMLPPAR